MSNPWDDEVIPDENTSADKSAPVVTQESPLSSPQTEVTSYVTQSQSYPQIQSPAPSVTSTVIPPASSVALPTPKTLSAPAPKKTSTSSATSSASSSTSQTNEKASSCSEKLNKHNYRSSLIGFVSALARMIITPSILLRQMVFSAVDKQSLQKSEITSRLYMASVGFILIDVLPLAVLFCILYIASSLALMLYISPLVYFTHGLAICILSAIVTIPFVYQSFSPSSLIKSSEHGNEKKETKDGSGKRSSRSAGGTAMRDVRGATLLVIIVLFSIPLAVVIVDVLIGLFASNYLYDHSIILSVSFALTTRCLVQIPLFLLAISLGYAFQYHYMIKALHGDVITNSNNPALISELCPRRSERKLKFGSDAHKVARYISALWLGDESVVSPKKNDHGAMKTIQTLMSSKPEHLDRKLSRFIALFVINPIAWIDCSDHIVAKFVRSMSDSYLVGYGYQSVIKERHLLFAYLESPTIPLYSPELYCHAHLRIDALKRCHTKPDIKTE